MRWKPSHFCITHFLVNTLWALFLSDDFLKEWEGGKFLALFLWDVGILHEFGLNFTKILKTMIDKETIIFCGEYLKEDVFVFEKLHGDVFDIASKRLEEGYWEDDIFHVDFFGSDLWEVEKKFFTFHLLQKVCQ